MKTLPVVMAAALMSLAAIAWTSTTVNEHVVRIDRNFGPDSLEIKAGDKVIWKNFDSDNHTVTSQFWPAKPQEEAYFDSGVIPSGGSFEFTFVKEGTCKYYCRIHPEMKGSIVVRP